MSDEPVFQHVCGGEDNLVDVVFVHGLTGDPKQTWCCYDSDEFWPEWIASELDDLSIYTLGYPAALFEKRSKKEMDMFERAGNALELLTGKGLGTRPIVFVTHSLGGILTKMILSKSSNAEDDDWRLIAEATRLVVFLSTPHNGATLADALTLLPYVSKHVKLLANQFGVLEDLNAQYRTLANGRSDLETAVYYEKHLTKKLTVVVSRESADPGIAGAHPVAVDKDHVTICKPLNRDDVVYLGVKRRIKNLLISAQHEHYSNGSRIAEEDYGRRSDRDRRDLLQKLVDAGREHEYDYANEAQNRFARHYLKIGLLTAAKDDHDSLLSEIETRFITHVYHPHICQGSNDDVVRNALQHSVIDPLVDKMIGGTIFSPRSVVNGLYFLTEQCHIRWDMPS